MLESVNVLDRNFFAGLNVTFSRGYDIITRYRNSINYGATGFPPATGCGFCGKPGI